MLRRSVVMILFNKLGTLNAIYTTGAISNSTTTTTTTTTKTTTTTMTTATITCTAYRSSPYIPNNTIGTATILCMVPEPAQ